MPSERMVCPHCGYRSTEPDELFCPKDGERMRPEGQAARVQLASFTAMPTAEAAPPRVGATPAPREAPEPTAVEVSTSGGALGLSVSESSRTLVSPPPSGAVEQEAAVEPEDPDELPTVQVPASQPPAVLAHGPLPPATAAQGLQAGESRELMSAERQRAARSAPVTAPSAPYRGRSGGGLTKVLGWGLVASTVAALLALLVAAGLRQLGDAPASGPRVRAPLGPTGPSARSPEGRTPDTPPSPPTEAGASAPSAGAAGGRAELPSRTRRSGAARPRRRGGRRAANGGRAPLEAPGPAARPGPDGGVRPGAGGASSPDLGPSEPEGAPRTDEGEADAGPAKAPPAPRKASPRPRSRKPAPPKAPAAPGVLQIVSSFAGGEVVVNNRPVGRTPLVEIQIEAGEHDVMVVFPGRGIWRRRVTVRPGAALLVPAEPGR